MTRLPNPGSDDGTWGNILNDFLGVAHNSDGTLKTGGVSTAGAEMTVHKNQPGGYAGLDGSSKILSSAVRNGISQQLAIIYEPCDLLATIDDLNNFGYYIYDNGSSGVGATVTAPSNGHLTASGTPVTVGQRIAVHSTNMYGSTTDSGIYVVTVAGSGSAPFVLTRATDANSPATLGAFFAVQVLADDSVIYFLPEANPFVVGTTHLSVAIEAFDAHAEGGSTATAQFATAEGQSTASNFQAHAEGASTASGDTSHAEGSSTAAGDFSHAEGSSYASGNYAHAEGGGYAAADYAHAESNASATGKASHAEGSGRAYANGMHAENGGFGYIGQFSRTTRSLYTNNAAPTQLLDLDSQAGLVFPDYYRAALVRVRVFARRIDSGAVSAWSAQCLVDGDNSGGFRFVGDPSFALIGQDSGASTWAVSDLVFNGSDPHQLDISVTGENGVNIYWTATIELDELT